MICIQLNINNTQDDKTLNSPHSKLHLQQMGDEAGQAMTTSSLGLSSAIPSENSTLREATDRTINAF